MGFSPLIVNHHVRDHDLVYYCFDTIQVTSGLFLRFFGCLFYSILVGPFCSDGNFFWNFIGNLMF